MTIKFGTEGWRAIIAEQFTAENVRLVAQGIAAHAKAQAGGRPVTMAVGYDTRFLSDYFARAVAEVLAGNGISVQLSETTVPTCAVSRYVVDKKLPLGVMITASHNPPAYNGIKIKEHFGGSAFPETVAKVEAEIGATPQRLEYEQALKSKAVTTVPMLPLYLKGIKSFINLAAIKKRPLKVIVDSMHGAGGRLIEQLLSGGRCKVETLHAEPDARFGGHAPEPIPSNLTQCAATVKARKAALGICNDGDADRLGIFGPGGVWITPGQVMCILIDHLAATRKMSGGVVKTVSNTMMINRLCAARGIELTETPVGFKWIAKLMLETDILIGGEESGGIGLKGYMPERDGIVNGLLVLEAIAMSGKPLNKLLGDLEAKYGAWYYGRRDLHLTMPQVDALFARLTSNPPETMAGVPVQSVNTMDGVKLIGRNDSWLLFRRSGTEPIVRVYAETPSRPQLPKLLNFGVSLTA